MFRYKILYQRHSGGKDVEKKMYIAMLFGVIVSSVWAQDNSPRFFAMQCLAKGNYKDADSAFTVAQKTGNLSAGDLLRWQSAKAVLSDFVGAAQLCCDIAKGDNRFAQSAVSSLVQMLDEQPLQTKTQALARYRDCALSSSLCDTPDIKNKLNTLYGSLGLFSQQDSLLVRLDTKKCPSGRDFFDAARQRFMQGFMSFAVFPAAKAYAEIANDITIRSMAATMLFEVYRQKGQRDSASLWLSRASLSNEHIKTAAIVFLQSIGASNRADSLIESLRPSVTKDTLVLRALAMSGDANAAYARVSRFKQSYEALIIWKCRLAVFAHHTDDITRIMDSSALPVNPIFAKELLDYRYRLEMLSSEQGAVNDFCDIRYALFRNLPKKAAAVPIAAYTKPVRDMLCCDIAQVFLQNNDYQNALGTMRSCTPDSGSCELQYLYGSTLILQGAVQQGKAALDQLMLSSPADVFCNRARVFLAELQKKK